MTEYKKTQILDNKVHLDKSHHSPSDKFYLSNKIFKEVYHAGKSQKPFKFIPNWLYNKSQYLKYKIENPDHLNKTYPRRAMVYVDFGVNSGSELSGSHFAIVLTKRDNPKSNSLTVVPLSSKDHGNFSTKIEKSISDTSLDYFRSQMNQHIEIISSYYIIIRTFTNKTLPQSSTITFYPKKLVEQAQKNVDWYLNREMLDPVTMSLSEQLEYFKNQLLKLSMAYDRFSKYNQDTYALTTQITTISKDRIRRERFEPIVRTTSQTLDKIEESIRSFFFK